MVAMPEAQPVVLGACRAWLSGTSNATACIRELRTRRVNAADQGEEDAMEEDGTQNSHGERERKRHEEKGLNQKPGR